MLANLARRKSPSRRLGPLVYKPTLCQEMPRLRDAHCRTVCQAPAYAKKKMRKHRTAAFSAAPTSTRRFSDFHVHEVSEGGEIARIHSTQYVEVRFAAAAAGGKSWRDGSAASWIMVRASPPRAALQALFAHRGSFRAVEHRGRPRALGGRAPARRAALERAALFGELHEAQKGRRHRLFRRRGSRRSQRGALGTAVGPGGQGGGARRVRGPGGMRRRGNGDALSREARRTSRGRGRSDGDRVVDPRDWGLVAGKGRGVQAQVARARCLARRFRSLHALCAVQGKPRDAGAGGFVKASQKSFQRVVFAQGAPQSRERCVPDTYALFSLARARPFWGTCPARCESPSPPLASRGPRTSAAAPPSS